MQTKLSLSSLYYPRNNYNMLTFRTYQLKQAKSYTREHLSDDGEYTINVHNQAPGLLRIRIQSRHINAKRYFCWIEYSTEDVDDKIVAWFCHCIAGQRTVGCCAHVASVLWYLGNERHKNQRRPLQVKTCSVLDAADPLDSSTLLYFYYHTMYRDSLRNQAS